MQRTDIPANINLLELTPEVLRQMKPTRVLDIFDGMTENFHPEGLFSVDIYGRIGTPERDNNFSYIDVKVEVFHPFVYKTLTTLKGLYKGIMEGRAFAKWDEALKDFVASDPINGETGYHFFATHWNEVSFKATESDQRDLKIKFLNANRAKAMTSKIVVIPAGLRDIQIGQNPGDVKQGEINDLYRPLISMSNSISTNGKYDTNLLDNTRWNVQQAFNNVYEFIRELLDGKGGFIQSRFNARKVFNGTRNVITGLNTAQADLADESSPNCNNTIIGLHQCIKGLLPVTQHLLLSGWVRDVFNPMTNTAMLIHPRTLKREQIKLSNQVMNTWTTSSGILDVIDYFGKPENRARPVTVNGYWLGLVYRTANEFRIFGDISELPAHLSKKDVYPLSLIEFIYLAGYNRWYEHVQMQTRYPIEGLGSTYPSFIYVRPTKITSKKWELGPDWQRIGDDHIAKEYPDMVTPTYMDSMQVHPSRLAGMSGDFDGDKLNSIQLYMEESRKQVKEYLSKSIAYVNPRGGLYSSPWVDTTERVLAVLMGD